MDIKKWKQPGIFYVLNINGITKFGITRNFENRIRGYASDHKKSKRQFNCVIHFKEDYDLFWQAEFVETMLRRRLAPWIIFGLEYVSPDVPTGHVVDCYLEIKKFLIGYNSFEHVKTYYKIGTLRMKLYKLYYIELRERFEAIEVI